MMSTTTFDEPMIDDASSTPSDMSPSPDQREDNGATGGSQRTDGTAQCTGTTKRTGDQCKQSPIPGTDRCAHHPYQPSDAPTQRTTATRGAAKVGAQVADVVEQIAGILSLASLTTLNPTLALDAKVLLTGKSALGAAVTTVCAENPAVRRALEKAFVASSWSMLVMAVGGIVFPIAQNHGLLPATPDPKSVLEDDVRGPGR